MTHKNLIVLSGLMIASLSLSGCSSLKDAINNKIASTAKSVSDQANTVAKDTSAALKVQGETMQKDLGTAKTALETDLGVKSEADMKNTLFLTYFNKFRSGSEKPNLSIKDKSNFVIVAGFVIDMCPPKPNGICDYGLDVVATDAQWSTKKGKQDFYLKTIGEGPINYYGPYNDDLVKIAGEVKDMTTLKVAVK